jgi:hypothetical protein
VWGEFRTILKNGNRAETQSNAGNGCNGGDRELEDRWMVVGDNPALMTELWWAVSLWLHVTLFIIRHPPPPVYFYFLEILRLLVDY